MAAFPSNELTSEEREELEALREEKARREQEARAAAERAELEALRAEQAKVDAQILAERAAEEEAAVRAAQQAQFAANSKPVQQTPQQAASAQPQQKQIDQAKRATACTQEKTLGERMVTSSAVDNDGIPTMPMAQKIIIAVALLAAVVFAIYITTH